MVLILAVFWLLVIGGILLLLIDGGKL
ncbi:hypothetical protein EFP_185 [Enterococcus phage EF24C]|uniref:Uncharacterized protein n=1 Tax=Enterococcus phage phiEF24C TaxID=442493 RepID=A8E2N7_BPPHE|nr:hypothetical protein EFP_gp185 [Enterococcus phage EF24C]BAF81453.1 hypothetical protein EFP_185 [Enterococcus phage EF24C]